MVLLLQFSKIQTGYRRHHTRHFCLHLGIQAFDKAELSFSSFLYTITKNRILNHIRTTNIKTQVHNYLSQLEEGLEKQADEELEFQDFQQILVAGDRSAPSQTEASIQFE